MLIWNLQNLLHNTAVHEWVRACVCVCVSYEQHFVWIFTLHFTFCAQHEHKHEFYIYYIQSIYIYIGFFMYEYIYMHVMWFFLCRKIDLVCILTLCNISWVSYTFSCIALQLSLWLLLSFTWLRFYCLNIGLIVLRFDLLLWLLPVLVAKCVDFCMYHAPNKLSKGLTNCINKLKSTFFFLFSLCCNWRKAAQRSCAPSCGCFAASATFADWI